MWVLQAGAAQDQDAVVGADAEAASGLGVVVPVVRMW